MTTHRLPLFACMLIGCTSTAGDASSEAKSNREAGQDTGADGPATAERAALIPLQRGLGHEGSVTEVWLDPRAGAALSLDGTGGVRLWPELPPAQINLARLSPIRVPIHEPASLSLARVGQTGYLIAAIDMAQTARVFEIEIDETGNAGLRERFSIPPSDPLLELHVLDGGQRLLALGVDHRIRLYDADGQLLSELREYGLSPWQLRFAGPPEALQVAMVLAGPTRLQRLDLSNDQLAKRGEPRAFVLDRGPNHNDLALLPSGRTAVALRRPKAKGPQFSIEVHDLDSGEVRVLWGEVEANWRPRLHPIADDRVLLEDGKAGYWVDLSQAVLMPAPFELPKKLEELPPETHVAVQKVELPHTERTRRMHASVTAGVRVSPVDRTLLLDPINGDAPHHLLGHRHVAVNAMAFSPADDRLALIYGDDVVVETLATGIEKTLGCAPSKPRQLTFTDADHLLMIGEKQAHICAWQTDQVVSTLELPTEREAIQIHPSGPATGQLGIQLTWTEEAPLAISHAGYTAKQLGPLEALTKQDFDLWPEFHEYNQDTWIVDASGNRYKIPWRGGTRKLDIKTADGEKRSIELDPGKDKVVIHQVEPSGNGKLIAIITQPDRGYGYYEYGYSYGHDDPNTLTIWSIEGEQPEHLWSIISDRSRIEMAWAHDGTRLAMQDNRLRIVSKDGDTQLDRGARDFHLDTQPDSAAPKP